MQKIISYIKRKLAALSTGKVIEKIDSDLNSGLEVVQRRDLMVLNSANANYSFGGLHRVFRKAFAMIKIEQRALKDVLILGFGAGSVTSILREELNMDCHITGVEKDPEVIRLARKYFKIDRYSGLKIVEGDAAEFINSSRDDYDLIIVDVYVDINVPETCESMPFLTALIDHLRPGGMVLFNKMIYNREAAKQAKELERKFGTLAGEMEVLKIREGVLNKVIMYEKTTNNQ